IDRIGNIGDWSEWVSGVTSADASDVLELLNEQITESQLHKDLQTKIDHIENIDTEIGPIRQDIQNTKDQISQEIIDRQHAIQNAEDGLSQKINDSEEGILEVIDTVKKSSDQGIAAAQTTIKVVADDLKLTAEKTDGVYAQLNPPLIGSSTDLIGSDQGFAGTWSVQSAIIEGDLALSKRVDTTVAQINDVQAFAQQEVVARVEGQKATVDKIDTYIAENDTALASVRNSAKIAVDTSKANGELIQSMELELDDKASTGQLTQVKSEIEEDYNDKITAQTTKIDGVYAQINPPLIGSESDLIGNSGSYAGVWSEQSARIEGDLAQSIRTDQVLATISGNDALYKQQIKANADAVSANVTATTTLQTTVGNNTASIQTQQSSINGINLQYTLKLQSGNLISGIGMMNDG
ncbi:phage tail protein, partial [Acinetobacter sp. ULE_I092]